MLSLCPTTAGSQAPSILKRPYVNPIPSGTRQRARIAALVAAGLLALVVAGCGSSSSAKVPKGVISAIGAENEYANVLGQIGGRYVHVSSILNNPNTDPHTFEASPSVAREVSSAELVVENGVGYDSWMSKILSASPNSKRKVINVQQVRGLPDSTPNPHLWYDPKTMPAAAKAMADDLSAIDPAHAATFRANETRFVSS